MDNICRALGDIKKINVTYEISMSAIETLEKNIQEAIVCTPIIGRFSTGKSALVNTLLGSKNRILTENITPETAIPTEILYTDGVEGVTIYNNDGSCTSCDISEYRNYKGDANTTKCARIELNNGFLRSIPDIMLVDMPGFESGIDVHNKAIDDYLPRSLAYIITFSADDMIVKDSIKNILKELCIQDVPLCVVITKYDKANDEFDITFTKLQQDLQKYIGNQEILYCCTSSFTQEVAELEDYLMELQEKSQVILAESFRKPLLAVINNTEQYLSSILNASKMSESELKEEEERLNKQLSKAEIEFTTRQSKFHKEVGGVIIGIREDVRQAIYAEEATFITMIMNNQEINERLNSVVRTTVARSIKNRFISKVEKYIKDIEDSIDGESMGNISISININVEKLNKSMITGAAAAAGAALAGIPILGGIVVAVFTVFSAIKERTDKKEKVRMKIRDEVFPQVLTQVENNIRQTIEGEIAIVNKVIEDEIKNQRDNMEKSIEEVRTKIQNETVERESYERTINEDLERVSEIKNGL